VSRQIAPGGRLLSPEDIAWAAVYFLSDEAALINGAILDVEQFPLIGRNPVKESPDGTLS
jgi:NAD(P)-dependent dehydrogenase (short-subunit alcohol dehydrogenase family)